jgi:hypothetical protein
VLLAIAQNRLLRYGPLRRIFISAMGHSTEHGLALWATAQNFVKRCGPQRGISLELETNQIPCIHIHKAVYLRECGCVSTCIWPCSHVHVAVYQHGHVSTCMWPCIHVRIWLCTMGHSAESGSVLWATAQNFVTHYGPQRRIWLSAVGQCAEFR